MNGVEVRHSSLVVSLLAALGAVCVSNGALAQGWAQAASLSHPGPTPDDSFGQAVSVSGGSILVGAYLEANVGTGSGAAYVFSGDGFTNVARLTPAAGDEYSFGGSVALDGDVAFVATSRIESGAVYVYTRAGGVWTEQQEINEDSDAFGYRLAFRGNVALIGAPKDNADIGKIHVYSKGSAGFTETQELTASDAMQGDFYGLGLAFDGSTAVVGAPNNAIAPSPRSGIYVYVRNGSTFSEQAKLSVSGVPEVYAGGSVDVSGDTIVVAAYPGSGFTGNGRAVVFVRNGSAWSEQQTLSVPAEETFATNVLIQRDTIWVGSITRTQSSVYVFQRSAGVWTQTERLLAPRNVSEMAVSGGTLALGLPNDDLAGGVQVFRNPSEDPPAPTPGGSDGGGGESGGCTLGTGTRSGAYAAVLALLCVGLVRRRKSSG